MSLFTYFCSCRQLWLSVIIVVLYPLLFLSGIAFAKWWYSKPTTWERIKRKNGKQLINDLKLLLKLVGDEE